MEKVTVIGAGGQLGRDVVKTLRARGIEVDSLDVDECDITNREAVFSILKSSRPRAVVNTAAYHNVPDCEKNEARAFEVNAVGTRNIALACREIDAPFLHVSTDYVFDGSKGAPYVETDCPRPLNVYAISKLAGEHLIAAAWDKHFIMRSSGLYGVSPCVMKGGMNFVDKMLKFAREREKLQVVDDEVLTPTYTRDLAEQIADILPSKEYGILHATSEGSCSWFEFAKKIFELSNLKVNLQPGKSKTGASGIKRPMYSVLENRRLKQTGLNRMRPWEEALDAYLQERGSL